MTETVISGGPKLGNERKRKLVNRKGKEIKRDPSRVVLSCPMERGCDRLSKVRVGGPRKGETSQPDGKKWDTPPSRLGKDS